MHALYPAPYPSPPCRITRVETLAEIADFLQAARQAMFGDQVATSALQADLRDFAAVYASPGGCMLAAWDSSAAVVGSIAYRPYDGRFTHLDLPSTDTVEVVRLFIAPAWRRQGLAGALFDQLKQHALQHGLQRMYLHTHPFLPGALGFWQQQGFVVLHQDADPLWQTIHMQMTCLSAQD
ncbi:GNAT family N-acetyltransferase [Comamonas piscis]